MVSALRLFGPTSAHWIAPLQRAIRDQQRRHPAARWHL